ncbi:MAG: hypothetical protein JST12_16395 [Armatimonadetes bacterium]|nr:hypothetical protein [Armatimonadota bacterium]
MAGSPPITIDQNMPVDLKQVLGPGVSASLDSDIGMLKSQRIFQDGLTEAAKDRADDSLATAKTFNELFPMFDLDVPNALNQYNPDQQRVVRLRVRAYSPDDAASIANHVALAFASYRAERTRKSVKDGLAMVTDAAGKAQSKLSSIDAQYRKLKADNNIADIQEYIRNITDTLESFRTKKALAESDLASANARLASLKVDLSKTPSTKSDSVTNQEDPVVNNYRQMEAQAETELANARQIYTDDSSQVKRAQEKYNNLHKKRIDAEKNAKTVRSATGTTTNPTYLDLQAKVSGAQADVDGIQKSLAPLNASVADYERRAAEIPAIETKFLDLQRDRSVFDEQYQKNKKWSEDLKAASEGSTSQIQSMAEASKITDPVAPDSKKYIILAGIVGSLIGLAYSFAIESFKLPVHTSWQLAELTALPVAASIPMMPKPLARRHYSEIKEGGFKPIESFRYMAFSMMAKENRPKVLLFTAVGEDVDSTAAAAEFAVAMSKTGSRTALVDCDLRLPRLSEMFGVQGRSGVAEILGRTILPGESTDLFVSTEHDNLMILPAGAASSSGLSDFVTSHMSGLIEDLREKADTVVINCPPVDVFADASRLAQYVDETCLVISAKTTGYRAIPVAQEILQKSGAKGMSIVLTNGSATEEPFGGRSGVTARR